MQELTYKTKGVCSRRIHLAIDQNVLVKVSFESGCDGNLQAISRLVEGMPVAKVISMLRGIRCDEKSSSCPDQLAQALESMGCE